MTIEFIPDDQVETRLENEKPCFYNEISFQVPVTISFTCPGITEEPASAEELKMWMAENPEEAAKALKGRTDSWGDGGFYRLVLDELKADALEMVGKGQVKFVSAESEEVE